MKIIKWDIESNGRYNGEFEVDDSTSRYEIEDMVKDIVLNYIDWEWKESEASENE